MSVDPVSAEAFEERYRRSPDPWDFRSSEYETGRYDQTIAALGQQHYRSAFEPGCSIGELTWRLATRCDRVLAIDVSETAVATARERCRQLPGVRVEVGSVADLGGDDLDLVVFSEVGYYFTLPELEVVVDQLVGSLEPGGELTACHWLGHSEDHLLHGQEVHDCVSRHPDLARRLHEDHDGFVIDSWIRS
ncbi:SAM-dependent methyltransferase [soil metagenome]